MWDLATVGDNCIDRLTGAVQAERVGGNALNVAVQAAGAGLRVAYAGAVGPRGEAEGDRVVAALRRRGVDVRHVVRRDLPTAVTVLLVEPDGERRILREDFGACAGWRPDAAALRALGRARHVHIGWLDDGGALRRRLAAAGVPLSQDLGVNAAPEHLGVEGLSVAFASLPESEAAGAEACAARLVARGARGAVVTLGAAGSLALMEGRVIRAEAVPLVPVDTTGAGDSYIAGFLAARLRGAPPEAAMAEGHALAARCCRHPGGFPQDDDGAQG